MSIIAIAGGTGGVGRTLVDAFNAQGKHRIIVLSRRSSAEVEQQPSNIDIIAVDYNDIGGMTQLLTIHGVKAVISTLNIALGNQHELNLIAAADRCPETVRFIPSVFEVPFKPHHVDQYAPAKSNKLAFEALSKTTLEWTAFYLGYFLDYYLLPKVHSYLTPFPFFIDVEHNAAAIPGSGNSPITLTHSTDVAKFVVAAFDLPKWERESYIAGDTLTLNEIVKNAEEVKGVKFDVVHDALEDLHNVKITELPCYQELYRMIPKEIVQTLIAVFGQIADEGVLDLSTKRTLNKHFPDIQPISIRNGLEMAWSAHN
jgi:nucleoside-diphosphate-sugar epimerase